MLDMVIDDELPESLSRISNLNAGLTSLKSLNCKIMQNPVENILRISCLDKIKSVNSIALYNNLGQLVGMWNNVSSQSGLYELSIDGLNQGLYTVVLISDNYVFNDKIVVE